VYGSGGWLWHSSTRVSRYAGCQHERSLTSSVAAVDAALNLSGSHTLTSSQLAADTSRPKMSKLHGLLKRRLQLSATENRIKLAVEDLISKYRTREELISGTSEMTVATKYSCYSSCCSSYDYEAEGAVGSCYSPVCRYAQQQAFCCTVSLPEELQQDLQRLSHSVPDTENENFADVSAISQNIGAKCSPGLDNSSHCTTEDASNGYVHAKHKADSEQSLDHVVTEQRTRLCATTKKLRLLTSLLRRHVCNGQICLTEAVVSRMRSVLNIMPDTCDPVCLSGTVQKSGRKRSEIPFAHDFRTRSCLQSVFVLDPSSLRHLARSAGILFTVPGFSSSTAFKKTDFGWIYFGPRPLFCTSWRYRTASARNLSAIALQLRVLWCCIRWDDMKSGSSALEDVHVTSETETDMVTKTTILRQRDVGQDGLRSEYLVRRVSAPAVAADDDCHSNWGIAVVMLFY